MLTTSASASSHNHQHHQHHRNGQHSSATRPYEFLPFVSFDDLHASIQSASDDDFRLTRFPASARDPSVPNVVASMADRRLPPQNSAQAHHSFNHESNGPSKGQSNSPLAPQPTGRPNGHARASIPPPPTTTTRPTRSASILRGSAASARQPSSSSSSITALSSSPALDAPAAPAAAATTTTTSATSATTTTTTTTTTTNNARTRRQSHYPPLSNPHVASKPPRKSIGPGVVGETASDAEKLYARGRRTSLRGDRGGLVDSAPTSSVNSSPAPTIDAAPLAPTSRAAKARSVQPTLRPSPANSLADSGHSALGPDTNRLSTLASRSPRGSARGANTLASAGKRASMMPGASHPTHATGLGARTVSPTDTRRLQRLSTMPQSQSLNAVTRAFPPPPPISLDVRANSRSPSMIPRRTSATPSSSRTTPDASNRKSYSSGLSAGSTNSFNTVRTSSASLQPRLPPSSSSSLSSSRLPAPKSSTAHSPLPAESRGDVPPVPAIPKAYESPKDSPSDTYFGDKMRSGLAAASPLATHGSLTSSMSMPVHPEPIKQQAYHRASADKSSAAAATAAAAAAAVAAAAEGETDGRKPKRLLQPLRLPPLNIGPLSTPTAARVASLQDISDARRNETSPQPSRRLPKTPSTPLTVCKSTFFSKDKFDDAADFVFPRSSSSIHHQTYRMTPTPPDADSSGSSMDASENNYKSSMSPFLSSSLPKGGADHAVVARSKTGGGYVTLTGNEFDDAVKRRPVGPREPVPDSTAVKSSPPSDPAPETPQTPSSMNSLRRKLSLSWKRGSPKAGTIAPVVNSIDKPSSGQQTKQVIMPPPRIPTSATTSSLTNAKQRREPSPQTTLTGGATYLESRRRKGSAASLTAQQVAHDRVQSDTWAVGGGKKAMAAAGDSNTLPLSHSFVGGVKKAPKPRVSLGAFGSTNATSTNHSAASYSAAELDKDDLAAEEEMRKMGSRRKETEVAALALDALRKRATPKERVSPREAMRMAMLNIYERGEIIDFSDVYFCGTQNARKVVGDVQSDAPNFGYDDERGDYTIVPGDHLAYRYEIVDVLGKGSFGQVVRCIDHRLGVLVAIKIIRNKKRFHQQALVEVNILRKLREWDPKNRHSMVNFTQHFYFRGHLCISTELLDMNLYEFIKAHAFRGFSARIIRRFTKQILGSLLLLKQRKVIHCDLKPENILLRHPLHSEIKVIDFGSSCFENEKVYTYIQSRFYRSPEVILGMAYGMAIDMWSVGCILAELYTGVPIFPGENEQEQLACIIEVFGPPEKHLIEKSTRRKLFFDSVGKPRLTVSSKGRRRRPSSKTLQQVLKCDDEVFVDFLARCLRWDPERRLKPDEAIRHEFITGIKTPATSGVTGMGGGVSAAARLAGRDSSPVRRSNTIATPRPLPDPPAAVGKATTGVPVMTARMGGGGGGGGGSSPHKTAAGPVARRISGATAATAASINRRTSAGGGAISSSANGLPRAAVRVASGKQDLAAAGATAAMSRRA